MVSVMGCSWIWRSIRVTEEAELGILLSSFRWNGLGVAAGKGMIPMTRT